MYILLFCRYDSMGEHALCVRGKYETVGEAQAALAAERERCIDELGFDRKWSSIDQLSFVCLSEYGEDAVRGVLFDLDNPYGMVLNDFSDYQGCLLAQAGVDAEEFYNCLDD